MLLSALKSFLAEIHSWAAYVHPADLAEMDAKRILAELGNSGSDGVFVGYPARGQKRPGTSAGLIPFSTFRFYRLQLDFAVDYDSVEVSVRCLSRST